MKKRDDRPINGYPTRACTMRAATGAASPSGFTSLIYMESGSSMSLIWHGKFVYDQPYIAKLAAEDHVKSALKHLLDTTSEQRWPAA